MHLYEKDTDTIISLFKMPVPSPWASRSRLGENGISHGRISSRLKQPEEYMYVHRSVGSDEVHPSGGC